jgi:hypothetical protein
MTTTAYPEILDFSVEAPAPPRTKAPFTVKLTFAITAAGVAAAGLLQLGLAWDGASIFVRTLNNRAPYFVHGRNFTEILRWPVLVVQGLTSNMSVLSATFGLSHAVPPLLALYVSWLVVRRIAPGLFVWAAIGILLVTLPGQAFMVSEAVIVAQFAWPLLLMTVTGLEKPWFVYLGPVITYGMWFLHPAAAFLFLTVAAVAVVTGRMRPHARVGMYVWAGSLAAAGVSRWLIRSTFEKEQASLALLREHYRGAVAGPPQRALILLAIVAVALILARSSTPMGRSLRAAGPACALLLIAVGAVLLPWGGSATKWSRALQYRTWVIPLTLPFLVFAAVDGLWGPSLTPGRRRLLEQRFGSDRRYVCVGAAAIFALTLATQGIVWQGLMRDVRGSLAAGGPCLTVKKDLRSPDRTALDHWAVSSLALAAQDRTPSKLLLATEADCAAFYEGETPAVVGAGRSLRESGWFELPLPPAPAEADTGSTP